MSRAANEQFIVDNRWCRIYAFAHRVGRHHFEGIGIFDDHDVPLRSVNKLCRPLPREKRTYC